MEEEVKDLHDFDWVAARFDCSPFAVFLQLRFGCERDVKQRNDQLRAASEPVIFKATTEGDVFIVLREGPSPASIAFEWSPNGITARRDWEPFLQATLTINDEGKCRLKVGDAELAVWQFRKRALEDLFFVMP